MEALQTLLLCLAVPTMVGFICRLALLDIKNHRPAVILMHVAMAMSVSWAGYHGHLGTADMGDFAAVVASLSWLCLSLRTWKGGVPHHFTKPEALEPKDWPRIVGGEKE
jgi:hypothetical protein